MSKIKEIIGNNLRALRGDKSQAVVAHDCGFEISSLSRWENSKAWASAETIEKLADYYNVHVSEIYIDRERPEASLVRIDDIKVSQALDVLRRRLSNIPDQFLDLAAQMGENEDAWAAVIGTMKGQIKELEAQSRKAGKA
jgi:transcriptional regulator with XRE-family HTH domain